VQKYISKFGGDSKDVMKGGGSAGGTLRLRHLARDRGTNDGLFAGAVGHEVSASTSLSVSESQYLYGSYAIKAGWTASDSVACIQAASSEVLQAANVNAQPLPGAKSPPLYGWVPVIEDDFILGPTYSAF
jgi:acetylcholinesterase